MLTGGWVCSFLHLLPNAKSRCRPITYLLTRSSNPILTATDLCKQVLGPSSLPPLLDALHTNTHIVHFLFGNNIIGPTAATQIASYITSHDQMQTWYLAGNCINSTAFHALVKSWTASTAVTNIWLKRNPLGPEAADDVFRLITRTPNLRTLDLDQTSLSDAGVARLFGKLTEYCTTNPIPLRHLYLNGVGAGVSAATNIAAFLSSPNCGLESLCLSKNPLGSAGTNALAAGIAANTSLTRLSLQSVGMSDDGAITLLHAAHKPDGSGLRMLDLSQSFATEDLGSRYNWLTDSIVLALRMLVEESAALRYLDLGLTQCSVAGLNEVSSTLLASRDSRLLYLNAKAALVDPRRRLGYEDVKAGQAAVRLGRAVSERLAENVGSVYGGMGYQEWVDTERRFVVSPRDVRFIDSVYRNRDAGLARRGLKVLDKWWDEGDGTLEAVMEAI